MKDPKVSRRRRLAYEDMNRQIRRFMSERDNVEVKTYKMTDDELKAAQERRAKIQAENKRKSSLDKNIRKLKFAMAMEG